MNTTNTLAGKKQQTVRPNLTNAQKITNVSFWSALVYLFLVIALHFIKPEFEPSWRFLSEYAIGNNGWIMQIAFLFLGVSMIACFFSLRKQLFTKAAKVGRFLLFIAGIAAIAGGFFIMDPVTATPDQLTTHGNLHGMAAMIGVPGFSIGALLISYGLNRKSNLWASSARAIRLAAWFILFSLILMFVIIFITLGNTGGRFTPEVPAGLLNRLLVVSWCIWLILIARNVHRAGGRTDYR